ncbi:MAG: alkaline phosphatase [bacterium]
MPRHLSAVRDHRLVTAASCRLLAGLVLVLVLPACSLQTEWSAAARPSRPATDGELAAVEAVPSENVEPPGPSGQHARNLILVIGDGMGGEQLRAASLYETGADDGLRVHSLPVTGSIATSSASVSVTDSAAAGTALATGVKVQNGVVGLRLPGDGGELPAITAELQDRGWAIGLVTTAFTTHATPAAFAAHVASRTDYGGIADDYLTGLRPDLLLGGGGYGMDPATVGAAGYTVVRDSSGLAHATEAALPGERIAGLFGRGHLPYLADGRSDGTPGLVEMAEAAVDVLARDDEGFFLMIEAARIDHAGHANDIARLIPEVLELDAVVEMLVDHPALQEDTLLVVTADHETGGLAVTSSMGKGTLPEVTWSTTGHTAVDVPLYAIGPGAEALAEVVDNTMVRRAMTAAIGSPEPAPAMTARAIGAASEE